MTSELPETTGASVPSHLVALVDDLHRSGTISVAERAALIGIARSDVARDLAADAARNDAFNPLQTAVPTPQELTMNPKAVINMIERNRSVMEAQLEKLSEFAPKPPRLLPATEETQGNVSMLLNTAVRGHLQGAADVLHAIAEVEAHVRLTSTNQGESAKGRRQPVIIDAEMIVIKPEESEK